MNEGIDKSNAQLQHNNEQEYKEPQLTPVNFCQLFRFATATDIMLIIIGAITSALMGAAVPVFAYLTGQMLDQFGDPSRLLEEAKRNMLNYIYLGIAALAVGTTMFTTWTVAGQRQGVKCRIEYYRSLMDQEVGWFDCQEQGKIATVFSADTLSFQLAIGQKLSTLIMLISMVLTGIGIGLYLGWILALIILAYLPILIICWAVNIAYKRQVFKQQDEIYIESDSKAQETLSSIALVKQLNAQQFESSRNKEILKQVEQKYWASGMKYTLAAFFAILALYLGITISYWYGSECVFGNNKCPSSISTRPYTAGVILKIIYALLLPALSLSQLTPSLQKIAEGKAAAAKIYNIIDRQPKIKSKANATTPYQFHGVFEFINVGFAYPKDKTTAVLHNLNMKIDVKHSALVGVSGCGKSTIFQLLMRFYDPDEGSILLDGVDLKDLNLVWLRTQIAVVRQQPVLFAISIRQNLKLSNPDASQEEMIESLIRANAYHFVKQLPHGLDNYAGTQLSGGQKQRIAIARALIKKPQVLLLDEATSALDRKNQREIMDTIKSIGKQFMTISITHRNRTLRNCEKVFYLSRGCVEKIVVNNKLLKVDKIDTSELANTNYFPITEMTKTQIHKADELHILPEQQNKNKEEIVVDAQYSRLLPYLTKNKCLFALGCLFTLTEGVMFPAIGVLVSRIIVSLLKYPTNPAFYQNQAYKYVYITLGVSFYGAFNNATCHMIFAIVGEKAVRKIRTQAFDKIIRMPMSWFEMSQNSQEKILSRLTSSCKALYNFTQLFLPNLIMIINNIICCVVGAIIFQWRTGLTALALIPLIIIAQAIQLGFIQGFAEFKGKVFEDSAQMINESILNIRTILSFGNIEAVLMRYEVALNEIFTVLVKKSLLSGFMFGLAYCLQYVAFALIFYLAAVYITHFNLSIDGSISSIFLIIFACMSAGNKTNLMQDLATLKKNLVNLFQFLDLVDQHEQLRKVGSKSLKTPIKGNIQFVNVSFKYEGRQSPSLQNFNMQIRQGEKIALVGPSGGGKSTIFKLILGLYFPQKGQLLIEGNDIKDYDLHHLRSSFGVVNQEPPLFNQSIEWNIRYNLADISSQQIMEAAKNANYYPTDNQDTSLELSLAKDGSSRPMAQGSLSRSIDSLKTTGLGKIVGPRGSHVSGGQKQRIAIARAMLRRPNVLLLDEATSALDQQNEAIIQKTLWKSMKGKTIVSITHHVEHLQIYQKIWTISDKQADKGYRDSLAPQS